MLEITKINRHMPSEDTWIKLVGEEDESLNIGVCYRAPALDRSVNTILFENI